MKFCPYCDEPIEYSDKFCSYCKRPLVSFISRDEIPIEKTLHPYNYVENQDMINDDNPAIHNETIERDIKEINKNIEQRQHLGELSGDLLLIKASLYYKKRDLTTSSKVLEIALDIFKKENDMVNMAVCHNELGLIQEDLGFFDNAIYQFDRAIEILKKINDIPRLIKVYNNIANVYYVIDDLEHSHDYYQTAMNMAREENLILDEVKSSSNLVDVLFLLKNYELIRKILDRNAFIFNQTGNVKGTITTLIQYGKLNYNLGEQFYEKSIELLNEALNLIHKIRTQLTSYDQARMQWEGQFMLGQIYLRLEDYVNSETYLLLSIESLQRFELGESLDQGLILEELGTLFFHRKDYDKAIEYFESSIKIFHKFGKDVKVGLIKEQIGQIVLDTKGDVFEAIRFFEEALGIFETVDYEKKTADILQILGDIYINNGMVELAIENFEKAREIYQGLEDEYNLTLVTEKLNSLEL